MEELKLVKTCEMCPEQYDIYQGDKKVAYVRLRFGVLQVNPYENNLISQVIIYSKSYDDGYKGCFDNDEEREEELNFILSLVRNYLLLDRMKMKFEKRTRKTIELLDIIANDKHVPHKIKLLSPEIRDEFRILTWNGAFYEFEDGTIWDITPNYLHLNDEIEIVEVGNDD